jgi:hypothetical protein
MPRVKPVILEEYKTMFPKQIIESHGGLYIRSFSKDGRHYTEFECENKHIVTKRDDSFKKTWCNKCQTNSIDDAHGLAKKMNGKFLSPTYVNSHHIYWWECS